MENIRDISHLEKARLHTVSATSSTSQRRYTIKSACGECCQTSYLNREIFMENLKEAMLKTKT